MADQDPPRERIIEQRLRNRAMEALEALADGDRGVRAAGNAEYINQFFDTIDDGGPWHWKERSTFTAAEVTALDKVQWTLLDACAEIPQICSDDEFIASGWPEHIKPVAATALDLLRTRSRYREDREEGSPSVSA